MSNSQPVSKDIETVLHVRGFRIHEVDINGKYILIREPKNQRPRYRKGNLILWFRTDDDRDLNSQFHLFTSSHEENCWKMSDREDDLHCWQITTDSQSKCYARVQSICWNPLDCPHKWYQAIDLAPVEGDEVQKDPIKWEQIDDVRILTDYYSELTTDEVEAAIRYVVQSLGLMRGFPDTICQLVSRFVEDICIEIALEDIQGWWQTTKTECAYVLNNNCTFDNFGQQFPVVELENEFLMNNWHLEKRQPDYFSNIVTWTGGQQWNTSVKWFRLPRAPKKFIQPMITVSNAFFIEVNGEYVVCGQSDAVPKFRKTVNDNLLYEIARSTVLEPMSSINPESDSEANDQQISSVNWYIYKIHKGRRINMYRAPHHVTHLPVPPHSHWTPLFDVEVNHSQLNRTLEIEFNQQARRLQRVLPPLEIGPVYLQIVLPPHIETNPEHCELKVRENTCDAQIVSLVKSMFGGQLAEENLSLSINGVLYDLNSRECVKPGKYVFFYKS